MNQNEHWVRETRIGTWFLRTSMWQRHVLPDAFSHFSRVLGIVPKEIRVLDIGCGEGFTFPFIDQMFQPRRLIGIDVNMELTESARRTAGSCVCPVDVVVGSAEQIELDNESIDMVVCHQSFHHFVDQEHAAKEMFRVLAPGGHLLFFESCRSFIYSWWIHLFFRHPMAVQKTAEEYLDLLARTGFEFTRQNVVTPYPAWARPDFGILEALGRKVPDQHDTPLLCVAARRPLSH